LLKEKGARTKEKNSLGFGKKGQRVKSSICATVNQIKEATESLGQDSEKPSTEVKKELTARNGCVIISHLQFG